MLSYQSKSSCKREGLTVSLYDPLAMLRALQLSKAQLKSIWPLNQPLSVTSWPARGLYVLAPAQPQPGL